MVTEILVTTDAHGAGGMERAARWAETCVVDQVIVTGDIGDLMVDMPVTTHIIRGNHEKEAHWTDETYQGDELVLHEDYSTFEVEGVTFGVLGRMDERACKVRPAPSPYNIPPGYIWLGDARNRAFEHRDIDDVVSEWQDVDVILFHDTPYPYNYGESEVALSAVDDGGSPYLSEIVNRTDAELVYHGHTHEKLYRTLPRMDEPPIHGLPPCDPTFQESGFEILKLHEGEILNTEYHEAI